MKNCKIIKGYYLTGIGQEKTSYYFKVSNDVPDCDIIQIGDICITTYQNSELISSIVALIRVEGVITSPKMLAQFLLKEEEQGYPLLPIVGIHHNFDPLIFNNVVKVYQEMTVEIENRKKLKKEKRGKKNAI